MAGKLLRRGFEYMPENVYQKVPGKYGNFCVGCVFCEDDEACKVHVATLRDLTGVLDVCGHSVWIKLK
jgi:hypothetical protein